MHVLVRNGTSLWIWGTAALSDIEWRAGGYAAHLQDAEQPEEQKGGGEGNDDRAETPQPIGKEEKHA